MANRVLALREQKAEKRIIPDNHRPRATQYELGLGVLVPSLASAPTCSTPDLAIVVSAWGGFSMPTPFKYSTIYTPSFACPDKSAFVMHHELSTLLHDKYTLQGHNILAGVFPITVINEAETPRQLLHEYLLREFNGQGIFDYSSMWSNSTWVFTVLDHLRSPDALYQFPTVSGSIPRAIDVLKGAELMRYNVKTLDVLQERLFAIWRRSYRNCTVEVGPVPLRWLHDFTPRQIVSGRFGVPVKPRRAPVPMDHNQQHRYVNIQQRHFNSQHRHPFNFNAQPRQFDAQQRHAQHQPYQYYYQMHVPRVHDFQVQAQAYRHPRHYYRVNGDVGAVQPLALYDTRHAYGYVNVSNDTGLY